MFVIPVAEELDLKKAAKAVGAKSIEMIHVKDINKITGYIRGGCSPVGMKKQFVTTYHETAQNNPVIMVSGEKIDLSTNSYFSCGKAKKKKRHLLDMVI